MSRKTISFAGCDYLGLASHPRVLAAARRGIQQFGLSVAASRTTTGEREVYLDLERELGRFLRLPQAVLLPDGYLANLAVAQAIAPEFEIALVDEKSHPSLADAARAAGMKTRFFRHRDARDAARQIRGLGRKGAAIFTDGLFPASGAIAPVPELLAALGKGKRLLLVDDGHGFGVLGLRGRGVLERFGVRDPRLILTTTLSKAFGVSGGVVAGSKIWMQRLRSRSMAFVGTTPIPPALALAGLEALRVQQGEPGRLRRLRANAAQVSELLREAGICVPEPDVPIFSFSLAPVSRMKQFARESLRRGIQIPYLGYPGGPARYYLKLTVSAAHTPAQLRLLARELRAALATP